jgi:sucrose-6-phosphate hydrolase SacC (GH32 family)
MTLRPRNLTRAGLLVVLGTLAGLALTAGTEPTCVPAQPLAPVCMSVADCVGQDHPLCTGDWGCVNAYCEWTCRACVADGDCGCGDACRDGVCTYAACEGRVCGDDGCGHSCGGCPEHYACEAGQCVYQPWCGDGNCDAGLGEDCSACPGDCPCTGCGEACQAGACVFIACDGKQCGPDGCGATCGACGDHYLCKIDQCVYQPWCGDKHCDPANGETCSNCAGDCTCDDGNACTVDACGPGQQCTHKAETWGPCTWPGLWVSSAQNPVLEPTPEAPSQGSDNVYAPSVTWFNGRWWMWYGGQGTDGHDRIFAAFSRDLVTWQKHPAWHAPQPVLDLDGSNHVNDPSVVEVGGTLYMFYTDAPTGEDDTIHLATSTDGLDWARKGLVLGQGAAGSWEADRVGRPSVVYEGGAFKMWYDGQVVGVGRHVGYATSPDGLTWTRDPANPVLLNEGAVDVSRIDKWYVLLAESHQGTRLYVATDPRRFSFVGLLLGLSGKPWDARGQVTPHLVAQGGVPVGMLFGGASDACWCRNRIGAAFLLSDVAGCRQCLPAGQPSCQAACENAGLPGGICGSPGSTNPGACCACQ